ncbi:unnamed protein product [Brassica rapa subsp. narinosa]
MPKFHVTGQQFYGKGQNSGVEGGQPIVDSRKHNGDDMERIVVFPSQYSPLQDIEEKMEENIVDEGGEVGKDVEDGNILDSKVGGKEITASQVPLREGSLAIHHFISILGPNLCVLRI